MPKLFKILICALTLQVVGFVGNAFLNDPSKPVGKVLLISSTLTLIIASLLGITRLIARPRNPEQKSNIQGNANDFFARSRSSNLSPVKNSELSVELQQQTRILEDQKKLLEQQRWDNFHQNSRKKGD